MKKFWKLLGVTALAVGLTPYKVEKDPETGENSYQALLYRLTSAPGQGEDKWDIGINLGEGTLTSKLMSAVEKEEPHLFSDELCVEYTGVPVVPDEAPAEPAAPAEPEAPAEDAAPVEPAAPSEPEADETEEPTAEEGQEEA